MWQNVYLKTAGAADYNKLATHALKWTDPTVTTAFSTLGQLFSQPSYLLGGLSGSLSNAYPACVDKSSRSHNNAEGGHGGRGRLRGQRDHWQLFELRAGHNRHGRRRMHCRRLEDPCYDFFPFPAPAADSANNSAIQGAGDVAMQLTATPQSTALIKYLAGPEGGTIWGSSGWIRQPEQPDQDERVPGYRDPGRCTGAGRSEQLRLQP